MQVAVELPESWTVLFDLKDITSLQGPVQTMPALGIHSLHRNLHGSYMWPEPETW